MGDDCHAWLEPPGSWGLANSGVIVGRDDVLVVDTQNDMPMARALLAGVQQVAGARPVSTVINTHADGDHWVGNLLFEGARVLASTATLDEMKSMWLDPARLGDLATQHTAFGRFITWRMSHFDYNGWRPVYPTETFEGEFTVEAAGREVRLVQAGPAHSRGDTIVHVPSAGVVFAGDVLFTDSTPIVWTGPLSRSVSACDRILSMDPRLVVPGHGPIVDADGVRLVRDYFAFVRDYASEQYDAGRTPEQAYADIDLGRYAAWPHASRVYQNILVGYGERDPALSRQNPQQALETVLADDDGAWVSSPAASGP